MSAKSFDSLLAFMKTVFPLGKDPPAITSLYVNHNGKILAAAVVDWMILMSGQCSGFCDVSIFIYTRFGQVCLFT